MLHEKTPAERRRHPRTQLNASITGIRLDPDGGDVIEDLHMVDLSRGGMGAISGHAYYRGQRLVVCLPGMENGGRRNMYATVVNSRQTEEGYRVGFAFDCASLASACFVGARAAA